MRWVRKNAGFSLIEFVLIFCILGVLFSMAFLTVRNHDLNKKEKMLKSGLTDVRNALANYYIDHQHFPCSKEDFNKNAETDIFLKQLLCYSNHMGEPGQKRSKDFKFGPYLKSFPIETITGNADIFIDTCSVVDMIEMKKLISTSQKSMGGWYYQVENGLFFVNLNNLKNKKQYGYF